MARYGMTTQCRHADQRHVCTHCVFCALCIGYCVFFGPCTVDQRNVHWGCTLNTTFRGKSELKKFIVLFIIAHTFSSRFNVFNLFIDLTKIQRKHDNQESIRASGMMFLNKLCYYKKRHCLDLKCTSYQRSIPHCRYMLLECHLGAGWKLFLPQVASCQWFGLLPELIHRLTLHVYRACILFTGILCKAF